MPPFLKYILLLCTIWHFRVVESQNLQPIACPQFFQYVRNGNQYIGVVTLPNLPMGTAIVDVQFSQSPPVQTNYYGQMSLYQDQQTTVNNLQRGIPISYRIDFPTPNVIPKLTRIAINNNVVCSDTAVSGPSSVLNLQHTLQTTYTSQPLVSGSNVPQQNAVVSSPQVVTRHQPQAAAPSSSNCGRQSSTVSPFVHGGTITTRGQLPWLTAIYQKRTDSISYICGGSLLSASTVLTAAHCFRLTSLTANHIVIYLGRHNLEDYSEEGVVTRNIRNLIVHPDYNSNKFPDADLAILQLQQPVSFTAYIYPICLWSESDDPSLIVGQKGYVAGWGADEYGRGVSPLPKMVDSNIVSTTSCLESLAEYRSLTSPRTICAGNRDGTGPCMGDSGSGLMINRGGRWMLRGIVSVGQTSQQQCNLREYVIYCDVAKHIAWVRTYLV